MAIWLKLPGIYLANKKRASHVHGLMREKDQSIQDMLQAFIKDGGTVIASMACSQAGGLTEGSLLRPNLSSLLRSGVVSRAKIKNL
jgi:hypothetical protein